MTEDEPIRVIAANVDVVVADALDIDPKLLAQGGGKFFTVPKPTAAKRFWARLRRSYCEWKAYFTTRTPFRTRWVFLTPIGDIVIYSPRPITQVEARSMLAHTAHQVLYVSTQARWVS